MSRSSKVDVYRTDPAAWAQDHFFVDRRWTGKRWRMGPGPIVLADYQADVLRHVFEEPGRYSVVVWSEPGKSGKSTLAALSSTWAALHTERPECYCVANDLRGARSRVFKMIRYCCERNPALRPKVTQNEIRWKDGTTTAIPADYRGEAGSDPTLTVFDECEHFMYSHQERLVAEFKVSPTRDLSIQWYCGYGGWSGESVLWENLLSRAEGGEPVLDHIRNNDGRPACWRSGRTFVFRSDVCRQPWQTEQWIETQRENLTPADFRRIVLNEFVPVSSESFVQAEWWDACHDPAVREVQAGERTPLVLALDLALGSAGGDHLALVGVCRWGDGDFAVKYARAWEPDGGRFDFDVTVGPALRWLVENCVVAQLNYDVYQAAHFVQQFGQSAWCKEFPQTGQREVADRFLYDLVAGRRLHHDGDETLRAHVLAAAANQKGENRLRIVKAGRRKIDLVVALSMACYAAGRLNLPPDPASQKSERERLVERRRMEAAEILAGRREEPLPDGPVTVVYRGYQVGFTLETVDGKKRIERGGEYVLPARVWQNLKRQHPPSWWEEV